MRSFIYSRPQMKEILNEKIIDDERKEQNNKLHNLKRRIRESLFTVQEYETPHQLGELLSNDLINGSDSF